MGEDNYSISQQFCKFPKAFIGDTYKISWEAKILYIISLDRLQLSKMNYLSDGNSWYDFKHKQCFIFYSLEQVMNDIGCAKQKAIKIRKELNEVGLWEMIDQGHNKPTKIFVKEILPSQVNKKLKYPVTPKREVTPPIITEEKLSVKVMYNNKEVQNIEDLF